MKTFKCFADVEQFRDHPLDATIEQLFLSIIADWLPGELRRHLEAHLDPVNCGPLGILFE
jgi:hypothetical protein